MKVIFYCISLFFIANISFANSDSVEAKAVCSRLTPEATRDACLKLIPNSRFDYVAVAVCDRMQYDADTLECMETIQDGAYSSVNAVAACEKSSTPALITNCLDEVASAGFQDDAVKVCGHGDPSLMPKCMEAIANRVFTPKELTQCRAQPSGEELIRCLRASGQDDEDEKKFRKDQENWNNWVKEKGQPQTSATPQKGFFSNFLRMQKEHPDQVLKCTEQKEGGHGELQKTIKNMQDTVLKCEYTHK